MNPTEDGSRVAIVGLAGRFPGAPNAAAFWKNLCAGVESIRWFGDDELLAAGESPALIADPGYVKSCPALADIDRFDAGFFGWSPREAAVTDPQHRICLETAWEALEDAGYEPSAYDGAIGVFASSGMSSYMMHHLVTNAELMEQMGEWLIRHTGNDMNFLATRISYELDLRGPSVNVQTACSSSLVAIHLAVQSLLGGESDMALCASATLVLPQDRGYLFKEGEILSSDGHCRPFDAASSGTIFGGGSGCVVLKRLRDAIADGDQVRAVIRGSAINNDGADKVGFLAPSAGGQARVISEALAVAGVSPEDIGFVEAHGTGTAIGDPIEIDALTRAFRASTQKRGYCALGSVKANVGHLGEAAGMAAFIKTVLSLQHRQIPSLINYSSPNPAIALADSPFFINTGLQPWVADGPRIAGVTALGAGGTNAHLLIEEAPESQPAAPSRPWQLVVVSARSPDALEAATTNLADHLAGPAPPSLPDVAYTLARGRRAFPYRRVLVGRDAADVAAALARRDPGRVLTQGPVRATPPVVLMFPGGGAQYAGMGADLYQTEPRYRAAIDQADAFMKRTAGLDLRVLLYPADADNKVASRRLEAPSLALPALFATEYALAKLLFAWGIEPEAMIGHSMGEYVAACLAGVLSYEDALSLVALRGQLFETLPAGGMLSVPLAESEVRTLLESGAGRGLSIAAVNGPALCVVSGPSEGILAVETDLANREVETSRIHIAVAAHSEMLAPILPRFEEHCRRIQFHPPQRRYVSNLTGSWITAAEVATPRYWVEHLRRTVRFADGLAQLPPDPNRIMLEVGPGRTLSSLARQQPGGTTRAITTLPHPNEPQPALAFLLGAVGRLWGHGVTIKWSALFEDERRQRVPLPTYPFERKVHWIPRPTLRPEGISPVSARANVGPLRKTADMADWFFVPVWRRADLGSEPPRAAEPPEAPAVAPAAHTLIFTDAGGLGTELASRLAAEGHVVTTVEVGRAFVRTAEAAYTLRLGEEADYEALIKDLRANGRLPRSVVHLWSVDEWGVSEPAGPPITEAASLAHGTEVAFLGLIYLARVLDAEEQPVAMTIVSTRLHQIAGEAAPCPAKALLLGPCRVIPREMPTLDSRSVDVVLSPHGSWQRQRLVEQLVSEVRAPREVDSAHRVIAFRGAHRLMQAFERSRIEHVARAAHAPPGLRAGGVYLVTGGLGGIGLALAEHLARATAARLILVARQPLPPRPEWPGWLAARGPRDSTSEKIRRIQSLESIPGVEVVVASADVRDRAQMQAAVDEGRRRFGVIHGVFHAAGVIDDGLIQLKTAAAAAEVIATKAEGAIVLDALFEGTALDVFVLFSSVSSILGFEGQVDYVAANAFLDAFAQARSARAPGYTVAVNWSAWRGVGMAAAIAARPSSGPAAASAQGTEPWPLLRIADTAAHRTLDAVFSREQHWLLGEHVVRGGDALIPGTGFLELARAAVQADPPGTEGRAVELRDVVFMAPFVVKSHEPRSLRLTLDKSDGQFAIEGGSEPRETHVTGRVASVDSTAPAPADLDAIRRRCHLAEKILNGFLDQTFMDFGPRWANMDRIRYGEREAVVELSLPEAFAADLDAIPLHPALLDMATGGAQTLIPNFDGARDFFVPFSYGRVLVRRTLPRRLVSHVRYRDSGSSDTAVFDVRLFDESGVELVAITDFIMKRGRGGFIAPVPVRASASALRDLAFTEGISPAEGLEALTRILSRQIAPQVVASSLDVAAWQAALERSAQPVAQAAAAAADASTSAPPGAAGRPALTTAYVGPRDETEQTVADVWQKILGIERLGVHDNFFELGGHSLLLIQAATRVRKLAGVDIPLTTFFGKLTIAEIAEEIRRVKADTGGASRPPPIRAASRDAYRTKRTDVPDGSAPQASDGPQVSPASEDK